MDFSIFGFEPIILVQKNTPSHRHIYHALQLTVWSDFQQKRFHILVVEVLALLDLDEAS